MLWNSSDIWSKCTPTLWGEFPKSLIVSIHGEGESSRVFCSITPEKDFPAWMVQILPNGKVYLLQDGIGSTEEISLSHWEGKFLLSYTALEPVREAPITPVNVDTILTGFLANECGLQYQLVRAIQYMDRPNAYGMANVAWQFRQKYGVGMVRLPQPMGWKVWKMVGKRWVWVDQLYVWNRW